MTTFPALIPSSRVFTPGDYGHTQWRTMGSRSTRSRHSNIVTGQQLQLRFMALNQASLQLILAHWINRRGRYGVFDLPDETFSGSPNPAGFTPSGYSWRYMQRPAVDDVPCGLHDVTVVLEMVPEVAT
jgi:hypothetical protein